MGHTYCTVLCAGVKSGVRIHGTHWCRGRSVVRLVQCGKESAIWCGSPWYRVVLWLPGAASWGRLSGSCPKLHNTLTAEQCAALRYNTLNTLHHCSGEPASARGYRGGPGAILPSLTPDLHRGGHSTKRSFASVVILGGHHEGVEEDQGKDWAEQQGGSPLPSRPAP